jgi:hypothetical protein
VTIGDASGRSVVLTLWNDNAHSPLLEGAEGQCLQVTSVRVGDYNGCSASSGMRSTLTLNPDTKGGRPRVWAVQRGGEWAKQTQSSTPCGSACAFSKAGAKHAPHNAPNDKIGQQRARRSGSGTRPRAPRPPSRRWARPPRRAAPAARGGGATRSGSCLTSWWVLVCWGRAACRPSKQALRVKGAWRHGFKGAWGHGSSKEDRESALPRAPPPPPLTLAYPGRGARPARA